MKDYAIIAVANFPVNTVLGLDASQAAARAHALDVISPADGNQRGIYRTTGILQFKVGETVQLETYPPKSLAREVVTVEEAVRQWDEAELPRAKPGKKKG